MSKSSPIIGKKIRAMTDGGWELYGTVAHDKSDRVILTTDSGETLLVFKKKVSAILIVEDGKKEVQPTVEEVGQQIQNGNFVFFKSKKGKEPAPKREVSDDDLSEGGVSLPHEVLMSVPSKQNFRGGDDDFSISMTSLFGSNRISVTSDDDSK